MDFGGEWVQELPPGLKDGTVLDIEGFNPGKVNLRLRVSIID